MDIFALVLSIVIVCLSIYIYKLRKINKSDSMTDSETGMGNLQYFKHHLAGITEDESGKSYYIAYIIMDSSYLRSYHDNMSFGEALRFASSVLADNSQGKEISARITENGFVFVFNSDDDSDAKRRLKKVMNKLNKSEVKKDESSKHVFYCAMYHLTPSDTNCEVLLFNLRKNCSDIFGTEKQIVYCDTYSMNKIQEENMVTENIIKGLDNNEFKMYLQFVVDNKTKKIVSAEALSRWENDENGVVGPFKYIRCMEDAGLITRHDFYMFDQVCRQLQEWEGTEYDNISISCNFTRITLSEENFIDKIKEICEKYTFDKSKLSIEITEDAMEKDRDNATGNVELCKKLGFKVYLDDLGSGYTSLSNLCDYPIDVVKIDRDILLKGNTERGKELLRGIIALAHSLNMKVICEGVETEEQNDFVTSSDCDYIQGWYYSKPISHDRFETFIKEYFPEEK